MALYQAYLPTCQENLKRFEAIFLDFPIRFNVFHSYTLGTNLVLTYFKIVAATVFSRASFSLNIYHQIKS